jgi:hypothetical protein
MLQNGLDLLRELQFNFLKNSIIIDIPPYISPHSLVGRPGGRGGVDPNHTTVKNSGILPFHCSLLRGLFYAEQVSLRGGICFCIENRLSIMKKSSFHFSLYMDFN